MIKHRDSEGQRFTEINILSERVIGAAIEVHRVLGPGLLESAYETCLARELQLRELAIERQVYLDLEYKGAHEPKAYLIDLIVDQTVLVEVKAIDAITEIHKLQLLTYLRLARKPLGLVVNFNAPVLWKGVKRVINSDSL